MGADLIVKIVKGPKKLSGSKAQRWQAIKRINALLDLIKPLNASPDPSNVVANLDAISRKRLQSFCETLGCDDYAELESFDSLTAESVVDELLRAWRGEYRDSNWRDFGRERIFVAGEQTWGDEPEGDSFRAIKQAEAFGILGIFRIK